MISLHDFMDKCIEYNKSHPEIDINELECCPIHEYGHIINQSSCKGTNAGIEFCKLCGKPMCPVCGNHNVNQLSRVTGYVSEVSGWNAAKQQELKDRRRYDI